MDARILIGKADELRDLLGCDVDILFEDGAIIIDVDNGEHTDICSDDDEAWNDLFDMVEGIKLYKKYREGK